MPPHRVFNTRRSLSMVYGLSVTLSILLMVTGIVIALTAGHNLWSEPAQGIAQALHGIVRGDAISFIETAVILLLLTPVLGLVTAVVSYLQLRRWRAAVISGGLLLLIGLTVLIALRRPPA